MPGRTPERQQNASLQNARAERQAAQNARPRTPGSPERQTQNARGPERQTQNASPPQNARAERQGAERQIENARTPKPEQNASRTPSRDCALGNLAWCDALHRLALPKPFDTVHDVMHCLGSRYPAVMKACGSEWLRQCALAPLDPKPPDLPTDISVTFP